MHIFINFHFIFYYGYFYIVGSVFIYYIDALVVCIYLLISLSFGIFKRKGYYTLRSFTFNKDITLPALVCVVFASTIGAGSSLGAAEKVYAFGAVYMIMQCLQPLYWLISAIIVTPGIEKFKGCATISDVMRELYSAPGEVIISIMSLSMCLGSLSIQALALGGVFNYFFDIPGIYGTFISYCVIVVYSTCGGIRAIIYNDIFKTVIVFFILPLTCIIVGIKAGGVDKITNHLPSTHLHFEFNKENILLIASVLFYSVLPSFDAEVMQRYLMARNSIQLRKCLQWIFVCALGFSLSIVGVAYIVKAFAPHVEPSLVFPYFINNFLPIGMKGLVIAGFVAIIMSMAEASLNSASLILCKSYLEYFLPNCSEKAQLNIFKSIIFSLALCSIILVNSASTGILDLFFLMRNFWDPIICIPVAAGFLGFRTNSKTFVVSTISTLVSILIGRLYAGEFATISFMFGVIGCTIGFFGTHYIQVVYGKLPRQIVSIISGKAIMQSFNAWIEGLADGYKRYANEEPRYNTFLYFTYIFLILYGGHIFWYGTKQETLVILWGITHGICILLILRECIFTTPWLQKILPLYFRIALIVGLPTLSSYILFTHKGDDFWILAGALSATCLVHVVDALRAIIYYTIGIVLAFLLLILGQEVNVHWMAFKYMPLVYCYFFFVSYAVVRNKEYEEEEKIENIQVFAGAIAHEVRNPLALVKTSAQGISMMIEDLEKKDLVILDSDQVESLKDMSEAITKISKKGVTMVESLLLSMRKEIVASEKEFYLISELVKESVDEYEELHEGMGEINIEIKENFKLECSRVYIKQLFFNLLNNAFKCGGDKIKITVDHDTIIFEYNGKGISKDKLPHVFKRFYANFEDGTGLGLVFCKMVIDEMGGDIWCESKEGGLTRFKMKYGIQKPESVILAA